MGVETAAPVSASTTVMRTPSLPGVHLLVEVPWPMPPPPLSMLPSPAAKAVAGNRHSTSARVQRRVEKSFIMYHAPYIFVHSQIPRSRAAGYLALAAFAKWIGNLWFPVHPLGSLLADKTATVK